MGLTYCDILPDSLLRADQDPDKVLSILLDAFCSFEVDTIKPAIESAGDAANIDKTLSIDLFLLNLGNPFPNVDTFTEAKKRLLARYLIDLYRLKGTVQGIEQAILFILGLPATVIEGSFSSPTVWTLGESELGVDTELAAGLNSSELYFFIVKFDDFITAEEQEKAEQIIEFMKPGWTDYTITQGFQPTLPFIDGFELWP